MRSGINFFDVSPFYGKTKAESSLGNALKDLPRDSFTVATKVGRYDSDVFDFSAERVVKSVEESMARLHVETLDIVHCHDIEFGDLDQVCNETIPALVRLKEAGKIRAIGITGYPLEIFPYVLSSVAPKSVDMVLSYCNYTLQNDRLLQVAAGLRRDFGVGIINASPLCMGLLTNGGCPSWHPAGENIKNRAVDANQICENRADRSTLAGTALQYALAADSDLIACTLVGIDSPGRLHGNLETLRSKCDGALLQEVRNTFASCRNETWDSGKFLGIARGTSSS